MVGKEYVGRGKTVNDTVVILGRRRFLGSKFLRQHFLVDKRSEDTHVVFHSRLKVNGGVAAG